MFWAEPASTGGVVAGVAVAPPDAPGMIWVTFLRLLAGLSEELAEPRRIGLLFEAPVLRDRGVVGAGLPVFGAAPALRIGRPRSPGSGGPSRGAWRGRPV